ncbi:MAG TPA: hypothetical protein VJS38_02140 [Phenylobacterium sp.]|uniref:hypothetical protein n=1 Tax=Phenylobacterium sp. TaxID=1871053 RepID=UPI002B4729E7|nr:hypothetical protein [Phenylobacterium sp.]HKR86948.1 hypothetical protein [Phenylobacterium sp.]
MTVSYELSRPLAFSRIKGPGLRVYRDVLPWVTVLVALVLYWVLPLRIALVGNTSVVAMASPFFASLPGFFIAALAAVATFHGADLDREMSNVTADMTIRGETAPSALTLRVFLCYLFAYLTAISFLGFFLCASVSLLAKNLHALAAIASWGDHAREQLIGSALRSVFVVLVTLVGARVVFCTALGLYFLAERVHQELS